MQPFTTHTGLVATMDRSDVDTDQIIPKQFLKRIERAGYDKFLFHDWRYLADGRDNPDFELNRPEVAGASVMLVRRNFGCGSSREHAVWALENYGIRVVIGVSFADIFYNNCFKNGVLPIALDADTIASLFERVGNGDGAELTVDLHSQTIRHEDGTEIPFEIDEFRRHCLLHGLDDIDLTLEHEEKITAHEARIGDA
jgi:3-isopropylmalate/(R)-2-methylmalate dehydratase small subunit